MKPTDWTKRSPAKEGHIEPTRTVGPKGPMARGATTRHGRTVTTLENGASAGGNNIASSKGFMPKPKGK